MSRGKTGVYSVSPSHTSRPFSAQIALVRAPIHVFNQLAHVMFGTHIQYR